MRIYIKHQLVSITSFLFTLLFISDPQVYSQINEPITNSINSCVVSNSVEYIGDTIVLPVFSIANWSAISNSDWVTIESDSMEIELIFAENISSYSREAEINIVGDISSTTFLIIQNGAPCFIYASDNHLNVRSNSGTSTISISSNAEWSVSDNTDWLNTYKEGNNVIISFDENQDLNVRSGTIYINGDDCSEEVSIVQHGDQCYIAIDEPIINVKSSSGTIIIPIFSNTDWSINGDYDQWLNASRNGDNVIISYVENIVTEERSTNIYISGGGCSEEVTIIQSSAPTSLSVSPKIIYLDNLMGSTSTVSITSNSFWNIDQAEDWFHISQSQGSNNQIITITALSNNFSINEIRSAKIVISNNNNLEEEVIINQDVSSSEYDSILFKFQVYPNPAYNELFVDLGSVYNNVEIRIIDISGTILSIFRFEEQQKLNIDINNIKNGIHLLEIYTEEEKHVRRFVKM